MELYYSVSQDILTDSAGNPLPCQPRLAYGDVLPIAFTGLDSSGAAADLSAASHWEFSIDSDLSSQTGPLCGTSDVAYDSTNRRLAFTVSAKTLKFLNAVDGKGDVFLFAELSGYDSTENRVFRFRWNMAGVMPVDADGTTPEPVSPSGASSSYTAFRVYADDTDDHTQLYQVGSYCPQFVPSCVRFRGEDIDAMPLKLKELYQDHDDPTDAEIRNALGHVKYSVIPKSMTERFVVLADTDWQGSDVVVDWGDGTRSALRNGKTQEPRGEGFYDDNECIDDWLDTQYMFSHTYENSGSYLVKIYGRKYWGLRHYYADLKNADGTSKYPDNTSLYRASFDLVYEVGGHDTPVADNVMNLASFMRGNLRLLHVMWTEINWRAMTGAYNWAYAFAECKNLTSARGLYFSGYYFTGVMTARCLFGYCPSLEIFNGSLPAYCSSAIGYKEAFTNCRQLRGDLNSILPSTGFISRQINAGQIFMNCESLAGTVPANLLWNDPMVSWSDTQQAFAGCDASILAQVPASWGGTAQQQS